MIHILNSNEPTVAFWYILPFDKRMQLLMNEQMYYLQVGRNGNRNSFIDQEKKDRLQAIVFKIFALE